MAERRGSAAQRGYDSRWRKAREAFLAEHPLCAMCAARGRTVPATVVDHITPHRGDQRLFWSSDNWQALCAPCHDSAKQREEKGGGVMGCDAAGLPLDPTHPWR